LYQRDTVHILYIYANQKTMELKPWLKKINLRLIIIHFAACWLFTYAFWLLGYLYDVHVTKVIVFNDPVEKAYLFGKGNGGHRVGHGITMLFWFPLIGLLIAFVILIAIDVYRKWYRVNSLIAFFVMYFLWRFNIDGWRYLKKIFLLQGSFFMSNIYTYVSINAGILVAIAALLLFNKKIVAFINNGYKTVPATMVS